MIKERYNTYRKPSLVEKRLFFILSEKKPGIPNRKTILFPEEKRHYFLIIVHLTCH